LTPVCVFFVCILVTVALALQHDSALWSTDSDSEPPLAVFSLIRLTFDFAVSGNHHSILPSSNASVRLTITLRSCSGRHCDDRSLWTVRPIGDLAI
jgi:hypothetical protein